MSRHGRVRLRGLSLEARRVPAVTATFANNAVTVLGDSAADRISIEVVGDQVRVVETGQAFPLTGVNFVSVDGGGGGDTISVSAAFLKPAYLFGGFGNDRITGGGGHDFIYGGPGSDILDGGPGDDELHGGGGSDTFPDTQGRNTAVQDQPDRAAGNTALELEIVALANQQRAANGLPALGVSARLNVAAGEQSQQMATLSHTIGREAAVAHTLQGVPLPTLSTRGMFAGYEYTRFGENIAMGFPSAASVIDGWMNSPGHRANILNADYTEIGVAVRTGTGGTLFFTQTFGKPVVPTAGTPPVTVPEPEPEPTPGARVDLLAVGAGPGMPPRVTVYDGSGGLRMSFDAYTPAFSGGVRVATGDVTGDGVDDVITAPGRGGGPNVRVFDGATGQLVRDFFAYSPAFGGGVFVAAGDVNGDGRDDIITAPGAGGGPHVVAYSGRDGSVLASFLAYDAAFVGGVSVAAGDVSGDGKSDIVTGAGPGGGPEVRAFDGASGAALFRFFAYDAAFPGGVFVAAGDVDGDGKADIITGAGAGGGPHLQVFRGTDRAVIGSLLAFAGDRTGGLRVAAADTDGDGRAEVFAGLGEGNGPGVQVRGGTALGVRREWAPLDPGFLGGVFVG